MIGRTPDDGFSARHPTEWNYQLLSYLNDNQLPRQRHAANLNFPIKSTPYTHTHTRTTLDTVSCTYSGSGRTQITPSKFRVIQADPQGPQWPFVHPQQRLTGYNTDCRVLFHLTMCLDSNLIWYLKVAFLRWLTSKLLCPKGNRIMVCIFSLFDYYSLCWLPPVGG